MKLIKSQLKQIIKEELGFGQGKAAPGKWSKKQEIVLEEEELEEEKNNPWAICTSSVGREDKAKYERCVKKVKKDLKENLKASEILKNVSFAGAETGATAHLPLGKTTVSPTLQFKGTSPSISALNIKHKILPNLIAEFDPIRRKLGLNWKDVLRDWDWEADVRGENVRNPKLAWKFALGKRFEDLGNIRLGVEYTGGYGKNPEQRVLGKASFSFEEQKTNKLQQIMKEEVEIMLAEAAKKKINEQSGERERMKLAHAVDRVCAMPAGSSGHCEAVYACIKNLKNTYELQNLNIKRSFLNNVLKKRFPGCAKHIPRITQNKKLARGKRPAAIKSFSRIKRAYLRNNVLKSRKNIVKVIGKGAQAPSQRAKQESAIIKQIVTFIRATKIKFVSGERGCFAHVHGAINNGFYDAGTNTIKICTFESQWLTDFTKYQESPSTSNVWHRMLSHELGHAKDQIIAKLAIAAGGSKRKYHAKGPGYTAYSISQIKNIQKCFPKVRIPKITGSDPALYDRKVWEFYAIAGGMKSFLNRPRFIPEDFQLACKGVQAQGDDAYENKTPSLKKLLDQYTGEDVADDRVEKKIKKWWQMFHNARLWKLISCGRCSSRGAAKSLNNFARIPMRNLRPKRRRRRRRRRR